MRLPLKILLFLLPLIIVPLLFLGTIAYEQLREATVRSKFDEMRTEVIHISTLLETKVNTAVANIELFANNSILKKYVINDDEEQRYNLLHGSLMRVFQSFQEAYPDYYEIRILMPDGYEDIRRTTTFIDNVTDEEGESALFLQLMAAPNDVITTAIRRNIDNNEVSLYVAKPLVLSDNLWDPLSSKPELRGYLILTVKLEDIALYTDFSVIGDMGYLIAVDDMGRILFKPEFIEADVVASRKIISRGDIGMNIEDFSPVMFDGESYYTRTASPHPNFHVVANYPEYELQEITRRLAYTVLTITVMAILVTTICVYMLVHQIIIRRLQRLGAVTREIARGNMTVRTDMLDEDEIGELATAVERMADSLQNSEKQVRYLAYHDSLTGLPNRAMFKEYLDRMIASSKRSGLQFALLFLDIDDFKRINDSLGHHVGDRLLQEVSDRLSHSLRTTDFLVSPENEEDGDRMMARLGGDEFTMLLPDIKQATVPGSVARRLIEALSAPVFIEDNEFFVSASIGITIYPMDSEDADELLKTADIAMYHAKEQGKNNYQYYRESMNRAVHERLEMENRLRKALLNGELYLHYQPQVSMETGEIVGVEALARWHDNEAGDISPCVFISLAEETGLILNLGEWVLNEACRQLSAWQKAGLNNIRMSVNVSNIQFARQNVADLIRDALACNDIDARYLEIEITESTIMTEPERAELKLHAVKEQGVSIALDDFGTGYSSLGTLHRFPIDTLKIDRSFISNLGKGSDNEAIVSAIIAMAHILELNVVAEGIEEHRQHTILKQQQCDVIQGYLYGKPLSADDTTTLLREFNRRKLRSIK